MTGITHRRAPTWRDRPGDLRAVRLRRWGPAAPRMPFAVIDVETTGLDPDADRVIEVAVVGCGEDGRATSHWSSLVQPGRDAGATSVHGITDDDLRDAPTFADLVPALVACLQGRIVVAHNLPFDVAFLGAELDRVGADPLRGTGLCTLAFARSVLPDPGGYSLAACCAAVGVDHHEAHRALADARVTADLLAAMIARVPDRRGFWRRRLRLA